MSGSHDAMLVAISIAIAIFASYTALDLAARVRASTGWMRNGWLITAAVAMGGGMWAMHFVAMLAFSMPGMEVAYDRDLTILSLLTAIVVTGLAFAVMARPLGSRWRLVAAGTFMGLGVVAMHYMGMAAMRMSASLSYDRLWVSASVLIAIGAATVALWLASRNSAPVEKAIAALTMGVAISGMHFAGMKAALFTGQRGVDTTAMVGVGQAALAIGVAGATFFILFLALIAAMFDRRFALLAQREADALRLSEERFRALYRGTPVPLHSLDQDGKVQHVSDAWLDLLGYARDEVVDRPLINFLAEASARRFRQQDWPTLLAAGELEPIEYQVVTKAGAFLDVVSATRLERDEQGNFMHVLGGLTNVTERKRAEDALRQAQKLEAIGQLTGGIAHDFNNLLAVIMGGLDLLKRRLPDDPKADRLLEVAMEGAQRGATLTQRLLAFARRQALRPTAVALPQLIWGMMALLQRSLGPQVRVETRFPLDLPPVKADPHQLEMALLNLALNARDAMPRGGHITISATACLLDADNAEGLPPGGYVKLSLTDEGEGMDAATLVRAAEPFFTTKGVGKGSGLGLSMVHGLAEQSGGKLLLHSQVGRGTTAELILLATTVPKEEELPNRDEPECAVAVARDLLVVDDDALVLASTAAMLEDIGHKVRLAGTGEDALAQLDLHPEIDAVVTDHLMPNMTGTQLAQHIAATRPHTPVLIVSGFAELADAGTGQFAVLPKPFDRQTLARAVEALVESSNVIPLRTRH